MIAIARFALAILYVTVVTALLRTGDFRPTGALYIPIVALAAAQGSRQAILVGVGRRRALPAAGPVGDAGQPHDRRPASGRPRRDRDPPVDRDAALDLRPDRHRPPARRRRSPATDAGRARSPRSRASGGCSRRPARRRRRSSGSSGSSASDLGYDFVSVYLGNVDARCGSPPRRGYDTVIDEFDGTSGVIGRVMRTATLAFVPDVARRPRLPERLRASSEPRSAPRCSSTSELVGIVNVEARATADLDASDVETMRLVAERMASALALAGERERLAARAELFRRLTSFATAVNAHPRSGAGPPGDRRRGSPTCWPPTRSA